MKRNAFLWSGAVIYLCIILLVFSLSHYGIIDLMDRSAYMRATADRLHFVSYNLLFDLNSYLSREVGTVARIMGENGGEPRELASFLDIDRWLGITRSWLDEEEFLHTVSVQMLGVSPHGKGEFRDLVQLNQLGLPKKYRYYDGAIDIDALLLVSLTDTRVGVSRNVEFRIRSLCPIRIFLLHDLSHEFVNRVAESMRTWPMGTDAQDLAESISQGVVACARGFLEEIRSLLFRGRVEYYVWTTRTTASLYEVVIALNLVEITDIGEFSFIVSDSSLQRVSYRLRDIRMGFRCRLVPSSKGSDTGRCEGVISS